LWGDVSVVDLIPARGRLSPGQFADDRP
jgi:hypothetical protein